MYLGLIFLKATRKYAQFVALFVVSLQVSALMKSWKYLQSIMTNIPKAQANRKETG